MRDVRLFVHNSFTPSERLCDVFLQICSTGVAKAEKGPGCLFDFPRTNFLGKRGVANLECFISKPPIGQTPPLAGLDFCMQNLAILKKGHLFFMRQIALLKLQTL